jgi:hypothetical protein
MRIEPWYKDKLGGTSCDGECCLYRASWYRYIEINGLRFRQQACDGHAQGEGNEEFRQSKQELHERGATAEECGCDDCCDAIFLQTAKAHYDTLAVANAKPYDLDNDKDACNRPFCRKCQGYHDGPCAGIGRIIYCGGRCDKHGTFHTAGEREVK